MLCLRGRQIGSAVMAPVPRAAAAPCGRDWRIRRSARSARRDARANATNCRARRCWAARASIARRRTPVLHAQDAAGPDSTDAPDRRLHAQAAIGGWLRSAISALGPGCVGSSASRRPRRRAWGGGGWMRTRHSRTWSVVARCSDAPHGGRSGRDRSHFAGRGVSGGSSACLDKCATAAVCHGVAAWDGWAQRLEGLRVMRPWLGPPGIARTPRLRWGC